MPEHTQPHNVDAEKTVLGSLLLDPDAIHQIRHQLDGADFYDPVYRSIYETVCAVSDQGKPVDFVLVAAELKSNKQIDSIGGSAFLAELAESVPTASHVNRYAEMVKNHAVERSLIKAGQIIGQLGYDAERPILDRIGDAQNQLLALASTSQDTDPVLASTIREQRYQAAGENAAGGSTERARRVYTGWSKLDHLLGGLKPKTLTVVAGRPAMGKSALLLNIAHNASLGDTPKKTLFVTLEMSKEESGDRMNAGAAGVSMQAIQRGELNNSDLDKIAHSIEAEEGQPLYIDDEFNCSVSKLRAKALQLKGQHGLDLLVVDYLQLLQPPTMNRNATRENEVSAISRQLKALAMELDIPVVVGCQLNRAVENRHKSQPLLGDLRESGSIEQDADVVLMLWREDYYNEDCDRPNVLTVFIRKHRNGELGQPELYFDKATMTYRTLDSEHSTAA